MAFFAVLVRRDAAYAASFDLRADRYDERDGALHFWREGLLIHQLPSAYLLRVEEHPDQRAASDAVAAHRRALAGGATIHVHETGSAAPRRRGSSGAPTAIPAEGLSVRLEER